MNPDTLLATEPAATDDPATTPDNQAAFESLASRLAAAKPSDVRSLNLKTAATRAFHVHREIHKQDAAELVAELTPKVFKREHLALLVVAANAASYAYGMLQDAKALKDDASAKLPPSLAEAATEHRKHMLKVAEYNLGHLPDVALLLADIRSGQGYLDLASDLDRLGHIFEAHKAALKKDKAHYQPTDAQRARDLDLQIIQLLGQTKQGRIAHWIDQSARVATILRAVYEDVAKTGRWVLRDLPEETLDERFPSLFAGKGGRPSKS